MKRVIVFIFGLVLCAGVGAQNSEYMQQKRIKAALNKVSAEQFEEAWRMTDTLIRSGNLSEENKKLVYRIHSKAGCYYAQQLIMGEKADYYGGIAVCQKTLLYADSVFAPRIQQREALGWYSLMLKYTLTDYDSAYVCSERAMKIYQKMGDLKNAAKMMSHGATAKSHNEQRKEALALYAKAEKMAMQAKDTALVISIMEDKQRLLYDMGKMKERSAVLGRMAELGYTEDNVLKEINALYTQGDNACKRGEYETAEILYGQAYDKIGLLHERLQGNERVRWLQKMRDLMYDQDRYDEALRYALGLVEGLRNSRDVEGNLVYDYELIADIYSLKKDSAMAVLYLDSVNEVIGSNRQLQVSMASLQLVIYNRIGRYEDAVRLAERADSIVVEDYGMYDVRRVDLLEMKGNVLSRMGRYVECVEVYKVAVEVAGRAYGKESSEYIGALDGLVNSMAFAGDVEGGAALYVELVTIVEDNVKKQLSWLTESERNRYWERFASVLLDMTSFGLKAKTESKEFIEAAYDAQIFSKALLLESQVSLQELVDSSGTAEDKARMQRIRQNRSEILSLSNDYARNHERIVQLRKQMTEDEQLLCTHFKEYADYTKFLSIGVEDVLKAMPANSVLVDYADIKTPTRYLHAAFITTKNDGKTRMELLFDWNRVEEATSEASIEELYDEEYNDVVREIIWDTLNRYVSEGCTVYYVPAGRMHQVALESFRAADGRLLGQHYNFVRLSSARELVKSHKDVKSRDVVLYGGLKYQMSEESMIAETRKYDVRHSEERSRDDVRGGFCDLPMTREEVDSIALLMRGKGMSVTCLTGEQGVEESFVALDGKSPSIIHFATHGFFYTPERAANVSFVQGYENAMMLSGLVMSGGNAVGRIEGLSDGLLRAGDIARLNLKNTDLVVLSACQTGLGKVTPEGVFGLQRAFKLAGVQTIVMTLWSVNDRVTKEFMVKFYECLLANSWNKRKSFQQARDYIRAKHPNSPLYWAGFIMMD